MRFTPGHALWVYPAVVLTLILCESSAYSGENLSASATVLSERALLIVNISYPDERDRQTSLNFSCLGGPLQSVSQQTVRTRYLSFELRLPPGCREPIVHLVETTSSGKIPVRNEFRLIPVSYPAPVPSGSSPTWLGPILASGIASIATLLATFLGARWTQFREESKAKFDLRRSLVEKEVAACAAIMKICRQMPSLSELESELNAKQQDFDPESPVLPAFYKLQGEARESGQLKIEILRDFEVVVQKRYQSLLKLKY